jgi:Fungal specific transcription factor domain
MAGRIKFATILSKWRKAPHPLPCSQALRFYSPPQTLPLDPVARLETSTGPRDAGATIGLAVRPPPAFPNVYFLDREVFDHSKIRIPQTDFQLDATVLEAFKDADAISASFFSWVHLWMPIVPIEKWKAQLTGPLVRPRIDVKILLFAMKLVLWAPGPSPELREPRRQDYFTLKDLCLQAEMAGMLSLELLQALILLTIYEYSHAIYPAAYISIGACARYGQAMGIDKQRQVEIDAQKFDLEEQEERRRVWWSVVILDRMISRSSTTPEPRPDDLLPVHDQAWDDGKIDPSRIYPVSSPASTNMGMLARLAQSAFLLGRVYRWKVYPTGNAQFDEEEKQQLDRALRALLTLTYEEGATRFMPVCPQTALCFSALITLHSQPGNPDPFGPSFSMQNSLDATPHQTSSTMVEILTLLRPIAQESKMNTVLFFRKTSWSIERSSPLLLHWTYLIAVTFLRIKLGLQSTEHHSSAQGFRNGQMVDLLAEAEQGLATMKRKLSLLSTQWVAADSHLRILEAREHANML